MISFHRRIFKPNKDIIISKKIIASDKKLRDPKSEEKIDLGKALVHVVPLFSHH